MIMLKKTILLVLQLGIQPWDVDDDIIVEEAWDDIVERIKYIFSDEVSSSSSSSSSKAISDSYVCKYEFIYF